MERLLIPMLTFACLFSHRAAAQDGPIVTNVRAFFQAMTRAVDACVGMGPDVT